jgi:glycosyltransferase involved in cell wall biosynthesis
LIPLEGFGVLRYRFTGSRHLDHKASVLHVVTPYGREGPSSRVRVYEWLERISEPVIMSDYIAHRNAHPGHLVRNPGAVVAAERRLRRMAGARPDRLLLHREASPLSRGGIERKLLESADYSVYDFDDALQWDWGKGGALRRLAPKAPKAHTAARLADRVIAGSPVLADWASEHSREVVLIPSCVAPDRYRAKEHYDLSDPPRLGWIGSRDNEQHLRLIAPALREAHRRTGARITLIGTPGRTLGDLEPMVDRLAWSETTQSERLAEFDVGIAPLPDDAYSRGKCGYKLLQYGAAATPPISSPVGVNREILKQFGAPAPSTADEWVDAILELLTMPTAGRALIGQRARAVAELHYSYDAWLPRWRAALGGE